MEEMEAVELDNGQRICLRPLSADDTERMQALFDRLSDETVRRRFLLPLKEIDPRELKRLATVDHHDQEAVAAISTCDPEGPIVAIARYARTAVDRAELAIVVEDDYQHLGLGGILLRRLIDLARHNGIVQLHGETLTENTPMVGLLKSTGLPLRLALAGFAYTFQLQLEEAERAAASPPQA